MGEDSRRKGSATEDGFSDTGTTKRPLAAGAEVQQMTAPAGAQALDARVLRAMEALLNDHPQVAAHLRNQGDAAWSDLESCIAARDGLRADLEALAAATNEGARSIALRLARDVARTQLSD